MKLLPIPSFIVILFLIVPVTLLFDVNKNYIFIFCLLISIVIFIKLFIANRTGKIYRTKTTNAWLFSGTHRDWSQQTIYDVSDDPNGFRTFYKIHLVIALLFMITGFLFYFFGV